jgi:hypothetical protein
MCKAVVVLGRTAAGGGPGGASSVLANAPRGPRLVDRWVGYHARTERESVSAAARLAVNLVIEKYF